MVGRAVVLVVLVVGPAVVLVVAAVVDVVVVADVVVVVGRVGSGAIVTGSPRLIRTNSPTVMIGCHTPSLQTSTYVESVAVLSSLPVQSDHIATPGLHEPRATTNANERRMEASLRMRAFPSEDWRGRCHFGTESHGT